LFSAVWENQGGGLTAGYGKKKMADHKTFTVASPSNFLVNLAAQ
jgi:hypothetical protein